MGSLLFHKEVIVLNMEQVKDKLLDIENVLFRLRTGKTLYPEEVAAAHDASKQIIQDYILPLENKE